MIAYPMRVIGRKSIFIELASVILSVLDIGQLILQTYIELADIVDDLRIDPVHLVDVGESVAAEIDITLGNRTICCISKTQILYITEKKNALPFLSITEGKPR
jgi:hypothetical protein